MNIGKVLKYLLVKIKWPKFLKKLFLKNTKKTNIMIKIKIISVKIMSYQKNHSKMILMIIILNKFIKMNKLKIKIKNSLNFYKI